MSSKTLFVGDPVKCPNCDIDLPLSIDRYAKNGKTGEASRAANSCPSCKKRFYVEHVGFGEYWIDPDSFEDYGFDEDDEPGKKW
jgi:hypothetical protein